MYLCLYVSTYLRLNDIIYKKYVLYTFHIKRSYYLFDFKSKT